MAKQGEEVTTEDPGDRTEYASTGSAQVPANNDLPPGEAPGGAPVPGEYYMGRRKRGVAIIINNESFDEAKRWKRRTGTDIDSDLMQKTLLTLGFGEEDIRRDCLKNLKKDDMLERLKEVAQEDFTDKDCFVCVILSYGGEGYVYGTMAGDEKIELEKITELFKETPGLAGKPKLFFIQACDPEYDVSMEGEAAGEDEDFQRIPLEADRLCVISRIQGSWGWLTDGKTSGSWFIEALTKAINDNWETKDFLTIMTRMNKALAEKMKDKKTKSLPYVTSSLTKDLFFKRRLSR